MGEQKVATGEEKEVTAASEDMVEEPPTMDQLGTEIAQAVMNQVFSTRRPQHICAGLSSALKSLGKGILLGVTTLIAAPAIGGKMAGAAEEEGENEGESSSEDSKKKGGTSLATRAKGVAVGMGAGILGALALPLTGAVVGLVQICRGAWNTPQALYEIGKGEKSWDQTERTWRTAKPYSLVDEEKEVQREKETRQAADRKKKMNRRLREAEASSAASSSSSQQSTGAAGGSSSSVESKSQEDYYELLGVAADADEAAIKKAYYKQARSCHPDKCGGDPKAAARFQRLSQAYQVLSDPKLRSAYDAGGADAVGPDSLPDYDPAVFFAALFGTNPIFENFVGDLALSQLLGAVATRGGPAESAMKAFSTKEGGPNAAASSEDLSNAVAEIAYESRKSYSATQREREVHLARSLADLLDESDNEKLDAEARALAQADYDQTSLTKGALVASLASSYRAAAADWLGRRSILNAPAALSSNVVRAANRTQAYVSAARAATRGVVAAKRVAQAADTDRTTGASKKRNVRVLKLSGDDLGSMPVSELKKIARGHGVDTATCCEKSDLVEAILAGKSDIEILVEEEEEESSGSQRTEREGQQEQPVAINEEAMKTALPVFLDALIRVSIVDVHRTLEVVAEKVLEDESVDLDARKTRATRLKHFAKSLDKHAYEQRHASKPTQPIGEKEQPDAAAARFERAVNVTMATAMGQDLSEFDDQDDDEKKDDEEA